MEVEFLKLSEERGVTNGKHSSMPEVQQLARVVRENDKMSEFECGEWWELLDCNNSSENSM